MSTTWTIVVIVCQAVIIAANFIMLGVIAHDGIRSKPKWVVKYEKHLAALYITIGKKVHVFNDKEIDDLCNAVLGYLISRGAPDIAGYQALSLTGASTRYFEDYASIENIGGTRQEITLAIHCAPAGEGGNGTDERLIKPQKSKLEPLQGGE